MDVVVHELLRKNIPAKINQWVLKIILLFYFYLLSQLRSNKVILGFDQRFVSLKVQFLIEILSKAYIAFQAVQHRRHRK